MCAGAARQARRGQVPAADAVPPLTLTWLDSLHTVVTDKLTLYFHATLSAMEAAERSSVAARLASTRHADLADKYDKGCDPVRCAPYRARL